MKIEDAIKLVLEEARAGASELDGCDSVNLQRKAKELRDACDTVERFITNATTIGDSIYYNEGQHDYWCACPRCDDGL